LCGSDKYANLDSGAQVVVKDATGTIIGAGPVGSGKREPKVGQALYLCTFSFTVSNLPDVPFYALTLDAYGSLTYTRQELVGKNWQVSMNLG
jgi:hypothetical protein